MTDRFIPSAPRSLIEKFAHLAAPLADERDDVDVGYGIAGDHAEKGRFSDACSGENADSLPFSAGEDAVDGSGRRLRWVW